MQQKSQTKKTHSSFEKGLILLTAFLPDNKEIGTVELSKIFGMNRSTVSRMLTVLKRQGFVRQNSENKKYSLGPIIPRLASAYQSSFESLLIQTARPHIERLCRQLNQTIVIEIPSSNRSIVAYVTEGFGPIRISARLGDRNYYHAAAGGKCILAFSSRDFIDEIIKGDLPQLTPKTIIDPDIIRSELDQIKKRGYAFDNEGNNTGINAFAVAILDVSGMPVAAVVCAGTHDSVTLSEKKTYLEPLKHTAGVISSDLLNISVPANSSK